MTTKGKRPLEPRRGEGLETSEARRLDVGSGDWRPGEPDGGPEAQTNEVSMSGLGGKCGEKCGGLRNVVG